MEDSFFNYNTSLKGGLNPRNGEPLLPEEDDDDTYENEEDYDALNDETFGAQSNLDDWEQQHEEFAEFNESSRQNEKLENSISQLVLEESSDEEPPLELLTFPKNSSVWAYTPTTKNGVLPNNPASVLSSLQNVSKSFIESQTPHTVLAYLNSHVPPGFPSQPGKICTVEELEKNLIKNSQQNAQIQHKQAHLQNQVTQNQNSLQQAQDQQRPLLPLSHPSHPYLLQHPNARLPPPGLPPLNIPPPNLRHLPPPGINPNHPLFGLRMMPPHPQFMPLNGIQRPPGYGFPLPVNHPFNFPPPPNLNSGPPMPNQMKNMAAQRQNQMQQHQQQYSPHRQQQMQGHPRMRHDSGNYRHNRDYDDRDEYSGLMTSKDKQWLLNIQMIQLNTGTPYFDDYYYTIYKERRSKSQRENVHNNERNGRYQNNGRQRRNSERQDNNNLTPRIYTPLQFENSLGKLQCGSVTAPRKIIDMDIVQPEKDQDIPPPAKDSRKTKQYLLELESLYSLLLRAEDIKNPLFISNMEKHREMKQKQRLRELEQAPTPEQKQEILKLFKLESEPIVENQHDYIVKICNGFVQEDKFASFLNIRKGKMLLLRLLPHLSLEYFSTQLLEIWSKVLLSLPLTGRRDTAGDNILPKLYPYFKRFVQTCTMSEIMDMISGLMEMVKQENSRSTPLSHAGKAPLYFVVLNKFGVSALICFLMRAEQIFSIVDPTEKQQNAWTEFLVAWVKHSESVSKVAVPLEAIPADIFENHVDRFPKITPDKRASLEKFFVDVHILI
ncbi:unnamed protein product [Ceutorhynchus assimilis]|uniref:Uncharacterized protein n=1 Tax=Ceutorhynchus assimilis TaxID=467358 RepID=A0A9N9MRR4_9CUCU|nr:unnamed protein product [Ceutorhynchus assimilis]